MVTQPVFRIALLACGLLTSLMVLSSPVPAFAKDKNAAAPPLDANAELTDAKLNPAVAKILSDAVTLYNTANYTGALTKIAEAKAIPNRTAYDDFQINNLSMTVAQGAKDIEAAITAAEAMAASPALPDNDRKAVYDAGMGFNGLRKDYWRAIQYGELLNRESKLEPDTSLMLAQIYFIVGSYADAERIAQAAIGSATGKAQKKLTNLVGLSQIKEGKVVATPSFGEGLLSALIAGAAAGVAQGTGQQAPPPPDQPSPDQQMATAQAASQDAEKKARQAAATEVLAADTASERAVYADLIDRDSHLSKEDRKKANGYFQTGYAAWEKEDYASAEPAFRSGLDIDPTNTAGNYYYADCLARRSDDTLGFVDYLTRALTFAKTDDDKGAAQTALKSLASPS